MSFERVVSQRFSNAKGLVAQIASSGDSCCESSVIAGVYEPICPPDLSHEELA